MSATKKKLAPDEAWERLEQARDEDDLDVVLAMSDAELDEELRKGGLDPHHVRQRGQRIGRELDRARERPEGMTPRWVPWLAAASMAAVSASVFLRGPIAAELTLLLRPAPVTAPPSTSHRREPTPLERAAALREAAFEACRTGRISECRGLLDEASGLDPTGDDDPRVVEARALVDSLSTDRGAGAVDDGSKTGWKDGRK